MTGSEPKNADLQAVLQTAPVGFAVVEGPSMIFTSANSRYLEIISRVSIVGQRWVDVFPELIGSPTHDAVRAVYEGQDIDVHEFPILIERDGLLRESFYTFALNGIRDAEGAVNGFVVIAVEVTELVVRRREAEALSNQLREKEARYRALFGAIDDGFCVIEMILDAEGTPVDYRFIEVNEAFLGHTGLVEPVGKTARELVPELDESWFHFYGTVAATGQPARLENNAPAMGRWFDVFASRVGDPALHQVGVVFKDVSARKRAEQDKERLLAAEQVARQAAESANRLKDEFLATVSHELRTPLNAVLGWTTLLRTGRVPADKHGHALEVIERNVRAQTQLIEDLLDVSRILEGKLRLDVLPTELSAVIEAAVETVRPAADAKGVRLQVALTSDATVMGDAHRLQQVVWNLLSNAVKFTPKGGRVQIVLERMDSSVELSVTDTGVGIGPEFLPHVFERFRQADASSTRTHGGLGLGLSIVRQLVEMHGGAVSVFSEGEGRGSCFAFRLPLALGRRHSAAATHALQQSLQDRGFPCPPELEGLRVLAVDDEEDSREMLRSLLVSCGAHVTVATSAAEAFQRFCEDPPAVLLSDIGMPGEDGFALIAKVRALASAEGGDTPAVALTAYARTEDRAHCLLAGFSNHVPKPIEPLELLAVVASLARRSRPAKRE